MSPLETQRWMAQKIAEAIDRNFTSPNVADSNMESANIVDAISGLGESFSRALKLLGNTDAATPMGAIEAFGLVMETGMERIAAAIGDLADAIRNKD